jgi:hypothetical protein
MKTIKDCVNCIVTPNLTGTITYLDFEQSATSPGELGLMVNQKIIQLEPRSVTAILNDEQVKDLAALEINAVEMLKSTLQNDDDQRVTKRIIEKLYNLGISSNVKSYTKFHKWANKWFGYVPLQLIRNDEDLIRVIHLHSNRIAVKSRRGPGNFIIVPCEIGARLQDSPNFVFEPMTGITTGGTCNKIGTLNGRIEVFVDPFMKYNERKFIVGKTTNSNDPGVYYVTRDEVYELEVKLQDTANSTKYAHVRHECLGAVGKNVADHFYTVRFSEKKHNLVKHLISKYLGYKNI